MDHFIFLDAVYALKTTKSDAENPHSNIIFLTQSHRRNYLKTTYQAIHLKDEVGGQECQLTVSVIVEDYLGEGMPRMTREHLRPEAMVKNPEVPK